MRMVSQPDGFMLENVERQLRKQVGALNLSSGPVNSRTSEELTILRRNQTIAYVSRKTGLMKGHVVVALHPRMAAKLDKIAGDLGGVSASPGKHSRYISSSNYNGFNGKGFSSELQSNEHQAAAFKVDIKEGLSVIKSLLGVC